MKHADWVTLIDNLLESWRSWNYVDRYWSRWVADYLDLEKIQFLV
jgi:hypothetical protein